MGKHGEATDASAELAEELGVAVEFADAADDAVEITALTMEQRRTELAEAREAFDQAMESYERCVRAQALARGKLRTLLDTNGLVRTAAGFKPR